MQSTFLTISSEAPALSYEQTRSLLSVSKHRMKSSSPWIIKYLPPGARMWKATPRSGCRIYSDKSNLMLRLRITPEDEVQLSYPLWDSITIRRSLSVDNDCTDSYGKRAGAWSKSSSFTRVNHNCRVPARVLIYLLVFAINVLSVHYLRHVGETDLFKPHDSYDITGHQDVYDKILRKCGEFHPVVLVSQINYDT